MPPRRKISDPNSVFINCPFDDAYYPLLKAIIFAVVDCGFQVRSALESNDGSQIRIEKLYNIIEESSLGIHDLSRTEVPEGKLPRFNMPLELGLFLACKRYGGVKHQNKTVLILDGIPFDYQESTSDIAGQDTRWHNNSAQTALEHVSAWLGAIQLGRGVWTHGDEVMVERYRAFEAEYPKLCKLVRRSPTKFDFTVYLTLATEWIQTHPVQP